MSAGAGAPLLEDDAEDAPALLLAPITLELLGPNEDDATDELCVDTAALDDGRGPLLPPTLLPPTLVPPLLPAPLELPLSVDVAVPLVAAVEVALLLPRLPDPAALLLRVTLLLFAVDVLPAAEELPTAPLEPPPAVTHSPSLQVSNAAHSVGLLQRLTHWPFWLAKPSWHVLLPGHPHRDASSSAHGNSTRAWAWSITFHGTQGPG